MARETRRAVETPVRHRPKISRTLDELSGTFVYQYQFRCTCGALGEKQAARRMAQTDLDRHVLALPRVPAAQQCRHPRQHDRRRWEPCWLCERQELLFDLAEWGVAR